MSDLKQDKMVCSPSIYFASQFPPTMCGIADYTSYLTSEIPKEKWGVIAFIPENFEQRLQPGVKLAPADQVLYSIPNKCEYPPSVFLDSIMRLDRGDEHVLWFQHDPTKWASTPKFVNLLKKLNSKKVITFHQIHFQSNETKYGMTKREYNLLRQILPNTDAITVFNDYIYNAVTKAFPRYKNKVAVIRHGVPISSPVRQDKARKQLFEFLIHDSIESKKNLCNQTDVFFDEDTIMIGDLGFIISIKTSDIIYGVRNSLQKRLPHKRIISVVIGTLPVFNSPKAEERSKKLENMQDGKTNFFFQTYLPKEIFSTAFKAFDVNIFWPNDCTQSGRIALAQSAGAVVIAKNLEGVGETCRKSGYPVASTYEELLNKTETIITNPKLEEEIEKSARNYAKEFSWRNQALKHCKLAEAVVSDKTLPTWDKGLSI